MKTATQLIERRKDHIGRMMYVIAGMVTTYSAQEAAALTDELVDVLLCPMSATTAAAATLVSTYQTPHIPVCHGLLSE